MLLSRTQVLELDWEKFREFIARAYSEGHYLDYKIALSGQSDRDQKREFLKDVTGFANALGGHIIIGVKEPNEQLSVDDRFDGLSDGEKVAVALENLVRDSTQPRVPGFFIKPVKMASGQWALVAHVPPSSMRPHMVDFGGHRTFYVRRHVSTEPMTVQELRDSFLTAATAEGKAKETMALKRAEAVRYFQNDATILFLQAVPLVGVEEPWPVEEESILSIVRGFDRQNRYRSHGFVTNFAPRITIDGVLATNNPEDPYWFWEVHRSGYISLLVRLKKRQPDGLNQPVVLLHEGFHDPFFVLAEMLERCWRLTGFDAPYALSAELFPARGSIFVQSPTIWREYSEPYYRDELVWPIYMRQPGQEPQTIARLQIADMYRGYGLRPPSKIDLPPAA